MALVRLFQMRKRRLELVKKSVTQLSIKERKPGNQSPVRLNNSVMGAITISLAAGMFYRFELWRSISRAICRTKREEPALKLTVTLSFSSWRCTPRYSTPRAVSRLELHAGTIILHRISGLNTYNIIIL